ncbi:MAG: transcription/translation regulatory transformer protein RfaH [Terrimicrobiaceae bacterium]
MPDPSPPADGVRWYCIHAKRFTEKAVTSSLRTELGLEVFCPIIRFQKARRSGKVWVNEALFPNYLFVRMDYLETFRRVLSTRGVIRIVSFGGHPIPVPEEVIGELRDAVSEEETIILQPQIEVGGEVEVVDGPLRGVRAIVTRVYPARQRVTILLEMLGTEREVEVHTEKILTETSHPLRPSARPNG